jgi:hypothetical protein
MGANPSAPVISSWAFHVRLRSCSVGVDGDRLDALEERELAGEGAGHLRRRLGGLLDAVGRHRHPQRLGRDLAGVLVLDS